MPRFATFLLLAGAVLLARSACRATQVLEAARAKGGRAAAPKDIRVRGDGFLLDERELTALGCRCPPRVTLAEVAAEVEPGAERISGFPTAHANLGEAHRLAGALAGCRRAKAPEAQQGRLDPGLGALLEDFDARFRRVQEERPPRFGPAHPTGLKGSDPDRMPPGRVAAPFAPGLAESGQRFHGAVSFSADGQTALWPIIEPDGGRTCMESTLQEGGWTPPRRAAFSLPGDDNPTFSGRKVFFLSRRPLEKGGAGGKENIWVTERNGGGWTDPRPLPPAINALRVHWQVSEDRQGNLYFGGRKEGNHGPLDLFVARLEQGTYAPPENLGPLINGAGFNHSPCIAPDGGWLLYSRCDLKDLEGTLLIAFRRRDGSWSPPRDLKDRLGHLTRAICPWVSPDGHYLLFTAQLEGKPRPFWMEAGFIEELRRQEQATAR